MSRPGTAKALSPSVAALLLGGDDVGWVEASAPSSPPLHASILAALDKEEVDIGSDSDEGNMSDPEECLAAAAQLFAHARGEQPAAGTVLGDLTEAEFDAHAHRLPEATLRMRARHFFTEQARVREGVRRWAEGDLRALGELVERSGRSSIELYECGCAEMNAIVGILNRDAECLGARASGGGWRGFVVGLVADEARAARVGARCIEAYRALPKVGERQKGLAHFVVLRSGDGARVCLDGP